MFLRKLCAGLGSTALASVLAAASLQAADEPTKVAPGTPVTITVSPAAPAAPVVSLNLLSRHGHVTPNRAGFSHTGGGNIDVQQPTADTVVITMSGVAVAGGHPCKCSSATMEFDLSQCFEITFEKPEVKAAKLTIEGRVIGLLRGEKGGSASEGNGCATVAGEGAETLTMCVPAHTVGGGESLSINDHEGPVSVAVKAGKYTLHQTFEISATHGKSLLPAKAASAEFAPDPALDPLWISYWEPFHGATKKDFGFQITVKVIDDTPQTPVPPTKEKLPDPKGDNARRGGQ